MPKFSRHTLILVAFACVYVCWGSTYLAIRIAGEHLPAAVVSGTRSLFSAVILFGIALVRGKRLSVPPGEPWRLIIIGLLFMSANNMLVTRGEQLLPSGFTSLVIAVIPIMVALLEALRPGGEPLNARGWLGTLLGTLGIVVLVLPSLRAGAGNSTHAVMGVGILLLAALAFAVGSVLSRRWRFQADTFVATGWQIGAAGIFNMLFALATGGLHRATWTPAGLGAIVYLSLFGSVCGLVAFTYLLQHVAVTRVATYAFVNPVIAVVLGAVILRERLARTELLGMAIILCAVAMVVYSRVGRSPASEK